jgi:hypothetical protein
VQREHEQVDGRHREVDVDGDPAAQPAEVVAGGPPVLVVHDLEDDALAVREPEQSARPPARLLDDPDQHGLDPLGGDTDLVLPAVVALRQRPGAGEQLVEPLVRGREHGLVGVRRPHAVAPLDLVGVRAGLARQHAGVGAKPHHLVAEPAVLELVEERLGGRDERARLDRRLGVDRGGRLGRPEVRVDDPVDVAAELEAQPDVALGGGLGHGGQPTAFPRAAPGVGARAAGGLGRARLLTIPFTAVCGTSAAAPSIAAPTPSLHSRLPAGPTDEGGLPWHRRRAA